MTSFRRWLIRGFFLTLLLLWAAGWGVSPCYRGWGSYTRGGKRLGGGVGRGAVVCVWESGELNVHGWNGGLDPNSFRLVGSGFWWYRSSSARAGYTYSSFCVVGFSYEQHVSISRASGPPYVQLTVGVPFWFLIVVSGVAFWWAWRKTRSQFSPVRAFPVETSGGRA